MLELPNKIALDADAYLTVQQIYRGWAFLGFVVVGALLARLTLTIMVRKRRAEFVPALVCFASSSHAADHRYRRSAPDLGAGRHTRASDRHLAHR